MSSSDINERAIEFLREAGYHELHWTRTAEPMADFATKEREEAVREFIEKVKADCVHGNWQFVMNATFREMFNKTLEG